MRCPGAHGQGNHVSVQYVDGAGYQPGKKRGAPFTSRQEGDCGKGIHVRLRMKGKAYKAVNWELGTCKFTM